MSFFIYPPSVLKVTLNTESQATRSGHSINIDPLIVISGREYQIRIKRRFLIEKEKIDILVTVGEDSDYINEGAIEEGFNKDNSYHFNNNMDAINFINSIKKTDDNILVKASNSLNFKEIVENIK